MTKVLAHLLAMSLFATSLPSVRAQPNLPPCTDVTQVNIAPDSVRQRILRKFVRECEKNFWRFDKGIVLLREYRNSEGNVCWLLLPAIDDAYRDDPPTRFADFEGDIILIFDADKRQTARPAVSDKGLLRCLEQIIGDRVYTRPVIRKRWTSNVLPITNKPLTEGRHRIYYGGNGGSLIIIFNPDGSYKVLVPV